jgi:hypothetical protein
VKSARKEWRARLSAWLKENPVAWQHWKPAKFEPVRFAGA